MSMRVLAIHAHPDDIEFVMAGTLLRLRETHAELHYMNIASGSLGTAEKSYQEIVDIRREESLAAAQFIGAEHHQSICDDMEVLYTVDLIRKVCAVVRTVRPDVMLIASPQDYMEDHMNACRLALSGAFARGMPNFQTVPSVPPIDNDVVLYHAMPHGLVDGLRNPIDPDLFVDITNVVDTKAAMLECHRSQKDWLDRTQGMGSYVQTMKDLSARVGYMSGKYSFAEGWRRHLHLGFSRTEQTPLEDVLL